MPNTRIKEWLSSQGISYRRLAAEMGQSPASVSQKVNRQTRWQEDDLRWLNDHYGLSSDFVLGLPTSDQCSARRMEVA